IAEVEVLGDGVGAPAAGIVDGRAAPQAARAVEVGKQARRPARGLLDSEVSAQHERLEPGQEGIVFVEKSPTELDRRDAWVAEPRDRLLQHVRRRAKVRIEDGEEFTGGMRKRIA